MKSLIILFILIYPFTSYSKVRNVSLDDEKMLSIKLRLGRSTLIRVPTGIKKVIIGNSNYYQFEFEGNEITLKPKDIVSTNLFLKTKTKSYGFVINVVSSGGYDDLIKVRDRVVKKKVFKRILNKRIHLNRDIDIEVTKLIRIENSKFICIEGWVKSSVNELHLKDVEINLSRKKRQIAHKEIIFEKKIINKGVFSKFRVYVDKELLRNSFRINFANNKSDKSQLISYRDTRPLL